MNDEVADGAVLRGPDGAIYFVPADALAPLQMVHPGTDQEEPPALVVDLTDLSAPPAGVDFAGSLDRVS